MILQYSSEQNDKYKKCLKEKQSPLITFGTVHSTFRSFHFPRSQFYPPNPDRGWKGEGNLGRFVGYIYIYSIYIYTLQIYHYAPKQISMALQRNKSQNPPPPQPTKQIQQNSCKMFEMIFPLFFSRFVFYKTSFKRNSVIKDLFKRT